MIDPYKGIQWQSVLRIGSANHMHMTNQKVLDNGYRHGIRHFPISNYYPSAPYDADTRPSDFRLRQHWPEAGFIGAGMKKGEAEAVVERWNNSQCPILMLHPRSAGHGLNLAAGGCKVLWLGPVWSRDLWEQTNARLWRRGQKRKVEVVTLTAEDSIDQLVVGRVDDKGAYEELFKQHIGA